MEAERIKIRALAHDCKIFHRAKDAIWLNSSMSGKILIVEDEQPLLEAYEMILVSEGYDVRVARDGYEALEVTKDFEPDMILLDLRMPRVNGIEFLKSYELKEKHPNVKVLVFSNLDAEKDVDQAYELGAERYIMKAWASPKELTKIVSQTLESKS